MNFSPLKDAYDNTQGIAIVLEDETENKRRDAQIAGVRRYLPTEVVDGIRSASELKTWWCSSDHQYCFWGHPWIFDV